jgi:heptosyltransferase III
MVFSVVQARARILSYSSLRDLVASRNLSSTSGRSESASFAGGPRKKRALVIRVGALGDLLLTRRLTYSLYGSGFHTTLLAPLRHASLLEADPWIEGVLDSESPRFAAAFAGTWPASPREFDHALVISESADLISSAKAAAKEALAILPRPEREDASIALQWAEAARSVCEPFAGRIPALSTAGGAIVSGASGATLIHPGSGSPAKNWPMERFAELSRRLERAGHRVMWIRGPAEADVPREFHEGPWIEKPGLRDLAATLAAARHYIGNDSGVSHLAGAVGARTLALFGPTNALVWRPDGSSVRVVRSASPGMEDISVESLLAALERD